MKNQSNFKNNALKPQQVNFSTSKGNNVSNGAMQPKPISNRSQPKTFNNPSSNNKVPIGPIRVSSNLNQTNPKLPPPPPFYKPGPNGVNPVNVNQFRQRQIQKANANKKKYLIIAGVLLGGLIILSTSISVPLFLTNKSATNTPFFNWNHNNVKASINDHETITDKETLITWLADPANELRIKSWFTNAEEIEAITFEVTGNGPFTITPTIKALPEHENSTMPSPIDDFEFEKTIAWIPNNVDKSIAFEQSVDSIDTLKSWLGSANNAIDIKDWFTNSQAIESVTISAELGPVINNVQKYNLIPTIMMKPGFKKVNSLDQLQVDDGKIQILEFPANELFGAEIRKLVFVSGSSTHLETLLNNALEDPVKKRAMIDNLIVGNKQELIIDVAITVEPQNQNQIDNNQYDINFTFQAEPWITLDDSATHQVSGVFVTNSIALSGNSYIEEAQRPDAIKNLNLDPVDYQNANATPVNLTAIQNRQLTNDFILDQQLEPYLGVFLSITHRTDLGPNHFSFQLTFASVIDGVGTIGNTGFSVTPFELT